MQRKNWEVPKFTQNWGFAIFFKKISTHLLTLLIMCVILHLEQRKGRKEEKRYFKVF